MKIYTEIKINLTEEIDETELIDAMRMNPNKSLSDLMQDRQDDFFAALMGKIDNEFYGERWELQAVTKMDDTEVCYHSGNN